MFNDLLKRSLIKHTCSWRDKLIVLWKLNRQAKIFLRKKFLVYKNQHTRNVFLTSSFRYLNSTTMVICKNQSTWIFTKTRFVLIITMKIHPPFIEFLTYLCRYSQIFKCFYCMKYRNFNYFLFWKFYGNTQFPQSLKRM